MGPTYPEKYPQAWHGPAQSGQVHLQPIPQHKQRHWDGRPPGLGAARHAETQHMRLCMMYKIAHTVVGDPWTEWLTTSKRVTRGFHAWKYIPIYSHHNIYKFSFLPRTIIDWNSLSPHSVDSPSIDPFRAKSPEIK